MLSLTVAPASLAVATLRQTVGDMASVDDATARLQPVPGLPRLVVPGL